MMRIISEHFRSEDSLTFFLLHNGIYPYRKVERNVHDFYCGTLANYTNGIYHCMDGRCKERNEMIYLIKAVFHNAIYKSSGKKRMEQLIVYNDIRVKVMVQSGMQSLSIKDIETGEFSRIDYVSDLIIEETQNRSIIYKKDRVSSFEDTDLQLIITFDQQSYEAIQMKHRILDDSDSDDYGFDKPNEGLYVYNIPVKFNEIRSNNVNDEELQRSKALQGVFIDPYIDDDGEQNFRCIIRPKPFNPSSETRETLRKELDKFSSDFKNYSVKNFLEI